MIKEILYTAANSLAPIAIVGIIAFLSWDVAVDKFLYPRIKNELISEKYLREEFREGKFIVIEKEKSFSDNHRLSADTARELINGVLVTEAEASSRNLDILNRVSKINSEIDLLEKKKFAEFAILESRVTTLSSELDILKAKELGTIEITVYHSDNDSEEDTIILNKRNNTISNLIENNEYYIVRSLNGNELKLKTRIQDLNVDGQEVSTAIARLYVEDYHKLFESEKALGIGKARITLEQSAQQVNPGDAYGTPMNEALEKISPLERTY